MSPAQISRPRLNNRSRGQVMVIFVAAILTFVGLCAIVVDVSWYWANTLRVQRAADAAALAGSVYLPVDRKSAFAEAQKAAVRNGYTNGVNGVKVIPFVDDNDTRQLDVRIEGQVQSFFAQAFGIKGWPVARVGEGVYIQPVPMGSPDAYYGVGDFWTNVTTTTTTNTRSSTDSGLNTATTAPGTAFWLTSSGTLPNAVQDNDSNFNQNRPYAWTQTDLAAQRWGNFGLTSQLAANQTVLAVNGIRVFLNDVFLSTNCNNSRVYVQLSWDGGVNWTLPLTDNQTGTLSTNTNDYQFGDNNSLVDWPHTWVPGDLADGKFEVRLTGDKGCSTSTAQIRVDQIQVQAYYDINTATTTTTTTLTKQTVKDLNGNVLPSRGAWGAMLTKGGNHENGDAYGPENNGGSGGNADYDPDGYDYIVNLPAGGTISVFDPGFCAMGQINAGSIGTGDHWVGDEGTPVSTYFTLKDTGGKPGLPTTWDTLYTSGSLFQNQRGYDPANVAGNPPHIPNGASSGCDPNHNKWWTFPVGNLAAGQYAIQVQTTNKTNGTINNDTNAENMFAFLAQGGSTSTSSPQVFGNGRMAVYNNLRAGVPNQQFYLAQVDKQTGLNKTMLLDIFDPGDVAGNAFLQILSPSGGSQNVATFKYTTDGNCREDVSDNCSNTTTGVTQIRTANNGQSSFNNTWIHITIPLTNYGNGGLWENGWWQIKYLTPDGGNDTTTWQVNIQGNPVHLVVP